MDLNLMIFFIMLGIMALVMLVGKLIDLSSENNSRRQALEVCANLCPSLLEAFGTDSVDKKISLKKVSKYVEAKEATSLVSSQKSQVEQIEKLFR